MAKTIVYRVVAIALLAGITYYYTGNAGEATTITILFNLVGTAAYYGLERLWESVLWGRGKLRPSTGQGARRPTDTILTAAPTITSPGSMETDSEANSAE